MEQPTAVFVGLDVAKARYAVAVAEGGRRGEVRYLGEIGADPESVRRLVAKLEQRHGRGLHLCYEAGPTGYGLVRRARAEGIEMAVCSPGNIERGRGIASRPTSATRSAWRGCSPPAICGWFGCLPRSRSNCAIWCVAARICART